MYYGVAVSNRDCRMESLGGNEFVEMHTAAL